MTAGEFGTYLLYMGYVALGIGAVNLFLYRKRGPRSLVMALACVALFGLISALRASAATGWIVLLAVVTGVLLLLERYLGWPTK